MCFTAELFKTHFIIFKLFLSLNNNFSYAQLAETIFSNIFLYRLGSLGILHPHGIALTFLKLVRGRRGGFYF